MKFTFTGCSITQGVGLEQEKLSPDNYCNIVGDHFGAQVNNVATSGNSNYNIFMSALNELLYNSPDILFVQWTCLNRLWLYPGPDTLIYVTNSNNPEYTYRDISYTKKQMQQFSNQYQILNHDYHNLITVIEYSNILSTLVSKKTNLVFINGAVPWEKDLIDISVLQNPAKQFSKYTKSLLDFNSRNDQEVHEFYIRLHNKIKTLDSTRWVNIFDSFLSQTQDKGTDNQHPGVKSHNNFAQTIIDYLKIFNVNKLA